MATFQFQLTDELVAYLASSGRSLANDFRFALVGGTGSAWTNPSAAAGVWLGIGSPGVSDLGNNIYQITADQAVSGNILFAVSSEITGGAAPSLGTAAGPGAPSNSTTSPLYSLAVGETTFGGGANDNADFSYENSFGLFLDLQAIDSAGTPTGTLINGGAYQAQTVYNYGYWGANNPGFGNVVGASTSTNLVPPLGAYQSDTSPADVNVVNVSNGAYHDFSDYLDHLSDLSGGSINLDDGNYKAWINYNSNDQYDAYARFYNFQDGDPEQDGFIILAGKIQGSDYSYLFPWTPKSLTNIGLNAPSANSINYLKNPNAIYGNNAGAIVRVGNFWSSGESVQQFFSSGVGVNTGSSAAFGGVDAYARAPGDLIFGLGYGILGSTSTTFNAAEIWSQVSLYSASKSSSAPRELGDLPSSVWYSEIGNNGATYNGPVAEGIWGGWAHPSYAAAGNQEYWNNYSYMLRGYIPSAYTDYLGLNPGKFGNTPVLDPGIYAWAMDDRLGKASVNFANNSGARFTIGKPWSGGPSSYPISGNVVPNGGGGGGGAVVPGGLFTRSLAIPLLPHAWRKHERVDSQFGFIWTQTSGTAAITGGSLKRHDWGDTRRINVNVTGEGPKDRRPLPRHVWERLDGYFSYELTGMGLGGSTFNIFETPSRLRDKRPVPVEDSALVKFNYSTGVFQEYKDSNGVKLYEAIDVDGDGYVDRFDMTLTDGSAYDSDRRLDGSYRDLTGYVLARRVLDDSSGKRKKNQWKLT